MIRMLTSSIPGPSNARIDQFACAVSLSEYEGDLWICIA